MQRFNSLGSDYPFRLAVRFAGHRTDSAAKRALESVLSTKYHGRVLLFHKGREALRAGLEALRLPRNAGVLVTGFTCYVVYKAVIDAGLSPVLVDINHDTLNPDPEGVERILTASPHIRAVIVQNTLGFPFDIHKITGLTRKRGIYILEDLAHSAGGSYRGGTETGTVGDLVALSFSQDKILDAVSGGALVIRNPEIGIPDIPYSRVPPAEQLKERFYPLATGIIRRTFPFPGKLIHKMLLRTGLLATPMGLTDHRAYHPMPESNIALALRAIRRNQSDISSRRVLSSIYRKYLPEPLLFPGCMALTEYATVIRFPIRIFNRMGLFRFLTGKGIHVTDTWYDAPVAPRRFFPLTRYTGECPVAETVANTIVNLPTHREISSKDAKIIAGLVTLWHTKQGK